MAGVLKGFSKRSSLKILAQLWDPIGLVSPVTIRIDLQGLWSSGYSWDDILPESIQQAWLENVQSINDLLSFQFDCKLKPNNAVRVSNSRILQWWGAGLCCGHFPTMETCWQTLSSCSSHDKGFRRTSEEEHPKIRTVGLLSTCTRVCYMCECIGVRKNSKLGKILRDPEEKWPSAQDHTRIYTHVDDLNALREKKTFRKEKKAGKHHSAATELCLELDQPGSEENPILLHLLKTCSTYSRYGEL